ncbi:hypothetical protein STSP2_02333 [Anaerohalosphaera lusitana]|uniref:Uncharacterized protein n=1 Tax=Anaerohalosphaera lusitana TaxID=1936003 RepID=A0A1U9NNQ6_9BACT|nr:hypothetical protein [Anaerohalosphaera lusitana]AQT69146.1 hypothetical protein STSP2_02333 [Anaerohalosphaera lusitana]
MDVDQILEDLLIVLESADVSLKREPMGGGGGGLCRIKDRLVFYVDTDAPALLNAENVAVAAADVTDLDLIYLRPEVRDFVEKTVQT